MESTVRPVSTMGLWVVMLLCSAACSNDADDARNGSGAGNVNGGVAGGQSLDDPNFNGDNADGNTAGAANGGPGPGGTGGEVTGQYIWIANSGQGTVSKIDTVTMVELGRYWTTANHDGHPSRTSVGEGGAVVVANRGNGYNFSGTAGVTKFHASEDDCEDRNGNGVIDTSTGADDIKDWGQDECFAWFTTVDFWSNRPVSWAVPTGPDAPWTVWTAGARAGGCTSSNCAFSVLRLNAQTGVVEERIEFSGLSGRDFISAVNLPPGVDPTFIPPNDMLNDYGPYGGAADAGGHFWGFNSNTMHLFRVDGVSLETRTWPIPMSNGYGITIAQGHVVLCGPQGMTSFDPASGTFIQNFTAVDTGYNGCMTDGADRVWVGGGATEGLQGLHAFDAKTLNFIESFNVGGGVKGVSIDHAGLIWGVGGGDGFDNDKAFRLDPVTGDVETFVGLTEAYSYSDMTGFSLLNAGPVIVPLE